MAKIQAKQVNKIISARARVNSFFASSTSNNVTAVLTASLLTAGDGSTSIPLQISTGISVEGLLVSSPLNTVAIYDSATKLPVNSGDGDNVYGRLTHSAGVYTLSYYQLNAGVETVYTIITPFFIDFEFPYRFLLEHLPTDFFISTKSVYVGDDPQDGVNNGTNGLQKVGTDVLWGGGLFQNTLIDVGAFGIAFGDSAANAFALLDLQSTTKGFLLPRMTQAELDAIVPTGFAEEALLVWVVDSTIDEVARLNFWSTVTSSWLVIATTQNVIDGVTSCFRLVSGVDGSTSPDYPAGVYGEVLQPTANGFIGGIGGKPITTNDFVLCINQNAGGNEAAVGNDWKVYKGNIYTSTNADALAKGTTGSFTTPDSLIGFVSLNTSLDCSGNPNYPSGKKGDSVVITVAGKIGGVSGKSVFANDIVICITANGGGTEASVGTSWVVIRGNSVVIVSASNVEALAKTDTSKLLTPSAMVGFLSINVGLDCSTNPNYQAGKVGDITRVTVAGKIGGVSGIDVGVNDLVVCLVANAGGTQAAVGANFSIEKNNANTNWKGVLAANPVGVVAGDWYNNSVDGVIYTYDGANWVGWSSDTESFISGQTGDVIAHLPVTSGAGSQVLDASSVNTGGDWNNVSVLKYRIGVQTPVIATANNARAWIVAGAGTARYLISTFVSTLYQLSWVGRMTNIVIDFANDPVLGAIGMFSDTTQNPTRGIYVRAPRLGESLFLRICIRAGGAEVTVTTTTVPWVAGAVGYFKFSILIDMPNNTVRCFIDTASGGNVYTIAYTTFLVSNPSFADANFFAGAGAARNGTAIVATGISLGLDSFTRSFPTQFKKTW